MTLREERRDLRWEQDKNDGLLDVVRGSGDKKGREDITIEQVCVSEIYMTCSELSGDYLFSFRAENE